MIIYIIKELTLEMCKLPLILGGNFWLFDKEKNGNERALLKISATKVGWRIDSNEIAQVYIDDKPFDYAIVKVNSFCKIKVENETYLLYCTNHYDETFDKFQITTNQITIGNDNNNDIICSLSILNNYKINVNISKESIVLNTNSQFLYVNGKKENNVAIKNGDIVFLMGLKFFFIGNNIFINNPANSVKINKNCIKEVIKRENVKEEDSKIFNIDESLYFHRSPRFMTKIEEESIKIDPPPPLQEQKMQPLLLQIGPTLTMAMISVFTGINAVNNLVNGSTKNILSTLPMIVMAISMLLTALLWPNLNRRYQKQQAELLKLERKDKYEKYVDAKMKVVNGIITKQKSVLIDSGVTLKDCEEIIHKKSRNLWERKIEDEDFLNIRLGIGNVKSSLEIQFPEEQFSLYDDELLINARREIESAIVLNDVPISVNLAKKYITAVVGKDKETIRKYVESLLLQLITFHSYEDLKIILLTDDKNDLLIDKVKVLPHCWDNFKQIRFLGNISEDIKYISSYLEEEFAKRTNIEINDENEDFYKKFSPYYLILTDSLKIVRNTGIINKIINSKVNLGFGLIITNDKLSNLPSQCFQFINIDNVSCGVFENELVSDKQTSFVPDDFKDINIYNQSIELAKILIQFNENQTPLPERLGFLEMYKVGNIGQLNILNRWNQNLPMNSLAVPVGVDESHDIFTLDLHEKYHGPHGLVAGMTGSGKSEFLITYILSLAVNFSPEEVNFVLIDYKGGGLAGAFYNKEANIKLPHLVGVITNLETNEIRRSILSINSELKRRQRIFNETREKYSESTINIYKYQTLYRNKKVDIPLPHLFIICDEFAELKSQQPEFLDNLISIARIGRSLGIHLILATQKPAGIVSDQIWSNSKFKVCLKVQDRSDSMDMLKREDAASLKETGRFYLQVGFNEIFKLGQSAWTGIKYVEQDKVISNVDTDICFVNSIGETIKRNNYISIIDNKNNGDELTNIVKCLDVLVKNNHKKITSLWLDSIPSNISLEYLLNKYKSKLNYLEIPFGEYDDPINQKQDLLTLDMLKEGNMLVYGLADTGKEQLLKTYIYSSCLNYTSDDINFYIIDFGTESLKVFNRFKQVGDIVLQDDNEKISNLFKMISQEKAKRKKIFAEYDGFLGYREVKKIPFITIIINDYETFIEANPKMEDEIIQYTRESIRYGISFILTSSYGMGIRYKLRQNFNKTFVLRLADSNDYSYVLGSTKGLEPAKLFGRGLFVQKDILEFQTAMIETEKEEEKTLINKLEATQENMPKALRIPVLPERVDYEYLKEYLDVDKYNIPVGVSSDKLQAVYYNFKKNVGNIISARSKDKLKYFIVDFVKLLDYNKLPYVFVDFDSDFQDLGIKKSNYVNSSFDKFINSLDEYLEKIKNINNVNNYICIFSNVFDLRNKLDLEFKKKLDSIFEKANIDKKINFIFINDVLTLKNLLYEGWFTKIVKNNCAIWIGDGLQNQSSIKLSAYLSASNTINDDFGYVVLDGTPIYSKMLINEEFYEESGDNLE